MASLFELGQVYTFNTLAPAALGAAFERVKMKGEIDADTARVFEPIDQTYSRIYPSLPPGTPKDPNSVKWYRFVQQNGTSRVLADCWIDKTSIQGIELVEITAVVSRASLDDVEKVRIALSSAGVQDFVISVK